MRSPGPQSAVMGQSNEFGEPDCVSSSTSFADIMIHVLVGNEARQNIFGDSFVDALVFIQTFSRFGRHPWRRRIARRRWMLSPSHWRCQTEILRTLRRKQKENSESLLPKKIKSRQGRSLGCSNHSELFFLR